MICYIAETGNMTKAAEKLFISQSALSQQLKDIENKLKTNLFFRTPKKMVLTKTGTKLLQTAVPIIESLEDAELEIAKLVSGDRGELKVGTQCIFCYKWLPRVMGMFQKKFPNIEFEIGNSDDLPQELESKKFDFIITGAPADEQDFSFQPLFEDHMVCIMRKDHPFSTRSHIQLDDFGRDCLISHSEKTKSKFYQSTLKPNGIEPKRFMAVGQPDAIIEMVESGFGISIFPRWAIKNALEEKNITALAITKSGLPLTWHAAFLKNSNMPVFQQEFIKMLKNMNPAQVGLAGI